MVRKTSSAILSLAIIVTGIIAFRKLNYWESSVWIFKLHPKQHNEAGFKQAIVRGQEINNEQNLDKRPERDQRQGRGKGYGRGMGRERGHEVLREEKRAQRPEETGRQQRSFERISSEEAVRNRAGRGRGNLSGGKKINLRNVLWYLAVFASFTVFTIFIDKGFRLIFNGKKIDNCQ